MSKSWKRSNPFPPSRVRSSFQRRAFHFGWLIALLFFGNASSVIYAQAPAEESVGSLHRKLEKTQGDLREALSSLKKLQHEMGLVRAAMSEIGFAGEGANGSVKFYREMGEPLVEHVQLQSAAFSNSGHKAPVFVVEVKNAEAGDWLYVSAQCTVNWRSFRDTATAGGRKPQPAFVASQIRMAKKLPYKDDTKFLAASVSVSAANGENIDAVQPYKVLSKSGLIEVKDTPVYVIYYVWSSSEGSQPTDHVKVVTSKGVGGGEYNNMSIVHFPKAMIRNAAMPRPHLDRRAAFALPSIRDSVAEGSISADDRRR